MFFLHLGQKKVTPALFLFLGLGFLVNLCFLLGCIIQFDLKIINSFLLESPSSDFTNKIEELQSPNGLASIKEPQLLGKVYQKKSFCGGGKMTFNFPTKGRKIVPTEGTEVDYTSI